MQRILALSPVFEVGAFTTDPRVTSIEHHDPSHSPTNANSLIWRVTFDEVVSNVDAADFSVTGTTATVTTVTGSGATYDVTASGGDLADLDATVTLAFASGQDIEDAAGNALSNTTPRGTSENSYRVDNTAPTVRITVPATSSAPFTATFTFSEPVLEFVVGDIGLGNATASNFTNITANVYTARIAPAAPGTVTVDVAAGVAEDLAGNGNTAALQARSTYTTPVVTCNAPNLDGQHQIWSALVTVGEVTAGRNVVRHGFTQTVGDLSERNFRIGPKSYNVREITQWVVSSRILSLTLNRDLNEYELNHLTLHVCAQAFPLNEATGGDHDYYWRNSGLDWSATPTRQVVLSALGEPTVEDRLSAGDCQDLDEYPNCGIGLSIDQRAGGYSDRGAIQSAGDRDLWTVVLYRAQSYLIEVKGAGDPGGDDGGTLPDPRVEIFEMSWSEQAGWSGIKRTSNDNVSSTNKNAGVVYTYPPGTTPQTPIGIRVSGANGATGSYTVSVKGLEGLAFTETADCETLESGNCAIEVGDTVRGTLSSFADTDVWAVPWEEGREYQIDARGVDSGGGTLPNPELGLRDSAFGPAAGNDDGGTGLDARIQYTVRAAGTYFIEIRAKPGTTAGTYTLTVTDISPPLEPPSMPRSLLAAPGDGVVVLMWQAPASFGGGPLEGYEYRHAAGTSVPSDTPWISAGRVLTATVKGLDIGTAYAFEVRAVNAAGAGDAATATATPVVLTETTDCTADTATACSVAVGGSVTGNVNPGTDDDYWSVTLVAGKTYQIDAKGADTNDGTQPNPFLALYGSAGSFIASDDNAGTDLNARLTHPVPTGDGGRHFISVTSVINSRGTYTLTLTDVTPEPQQEAPPAAPLTAEFRNVPAEHDGSSAFTFELHFSEAPKGLSYRTLRGDSFFDISNGTVTKAKRLVKKDNSGWRVTVKPASDADVTIGFLPALPADDCTEAAVVCTADGTRLSVGAATFVPGPASLSVADATVQEGPNATLDFVVSLSRARHEATTVDYATSDGTASAPDDYTHTAGTLTFDAGEREKTVSVPVLNDSHDEGSETMTFTLSNPVPAATAKLGDTTATGTITNSDPMPRAWLVRFGRTVGSQVVDALSERFDSSSASHVTVGGIELRSGVTPEDEAKGEPESLTLAGWEDEAEAGGPERTMTLDDLVTGTRFHLSSGAPDGGGTAYTAWGRVASGGFEAEVDDATMDGDVTSALIGFDAEWERALAGVMLSQSSGDGSYRLNPAMGDDAGTVKSNLTGVYPYARLTLNPKLSAWALAGMGSGELTLRRNGKEDMPADIEMRMGALGVNAAVLDAADTGGLALTVKSDAMWVSTTSDATDELRSSEGDVTRLRLTLHGERAFPLSGERTLTPSAEIGLRHDAGDAETGVGLEMGAGLRYSAGALTMEGRVRTLISHADSGYREWGASGSIQVAPDSSGRGLTLRIAPAWGATGSATERLWGARDAGELGAGAAQFEGEGRIESEVGYGLALTRNRGLVTPYTALSLGDGASRTWRFGARWRASDDVRIGLEGTQEDNAIDAPTSTVQLRARLEW